MSEKKLILSIDCEEEICGDCKYSYINGDYDVIDDFLKSFCHIYDERLEGVEPNPKRWGNHRVDNTLRCSKCLEATRTHEPSSGMECPHTNICMRDGYPVCSSCGYPVNVREWTMKGMGIHDPY